MAKSFSILFAFSQFVIFLGMKTAINPLDLPVLVRHVEPYRNIHRSGVQNE